MQAEVWQHMVRTLSLGGAAQTILVSSVAEAENVSDGGRHLHIFVDPSISIATIENHSRTIAHAFRDEFAKVYFYRAEAAVQTSPVKLVQEQRERHGASV